MLQHEFLLHLLKVSILNFKLQALRERGFVCRAKLTVPMVIDRFINGKEFCTSDTEFVYLKNAVTFSN